MGPKEGDTTRPLDPGELVRIRGPTTLDNEVGVVSRCTPNGNYYVVLVGGKEVPYARDELVPVGVQQPLKHGII
jgi:hypothetical protein